MTGKISTNKIHDTLTLLSLPPDTPLRGIWKLPSKPPTRIGPFHAGCLQTRNLSHFPGVLNAMEADKLWVSGRHRRIRANCVLCHCRKYKGERDVVWD